MKRRDFLIWGWWLILAGLLLFFVSILPKGGRDAAENAMYESLAKSLKEHQI